MVELDQLGIRVMRRVNFPAVGLQAAPKEVRNLSLGLQGGMVRRGKPHRSEPWR